MTPLERLSGFTLRGIGPVAKKDKKTWALHEAAQKMGKAGGAKGGRARADALGPAARSAIARKGAKAKNKK
jgi:hypothetical protein